jgi:hypothetical protein
MNMMYSFHIIGFAFALANYLWFTHQRRYLKIYEEYRKSDKNNNVTAMNKELYDLAMDEQTVNDEAIDAEEYSMNNIPDDDDFDYDNGEDGDYANGPNEDYD